MAIEPLPLEQRTAAIDHLGVLLEQDLIDMDAFESLKNGVLASATEDDLSVVLAAAPTTVRMTPPARRLDEPLVIETRSGALKLTSGWQLARETRIRTGSGAVKIDLSGAEFDDLIIDLEVSTGSGALDMTVPYGVTVQVVDVQIGSGAVKNELSASVPLPGMPVVRLRAQIGSGAVRLRRPRQPIWRWFHRLFAR